MRRLIGDPLIHFLLVGGLFFVVFVLRHEGEDPETIVVTTDQVERLVASSAILRQGPLSAAEREAIVEPFIRDEVYYREALALGLDEDDDQVRTRLVEKMRFISQDLADPQPASDEELRGFYESAPERFRVPELVTFEQIFFSPSQRGEDLEDDVAAALSALAAGRDRNGLGDRTPLRDRFDSAPREQIEVLFGETIAETLFATESTRWQGPYESDFGLHLVKLVERTATHQPEFEEIRDEVLEQYAETRRRERNEAAYQTMRARYDVRVEWPDDETVE
jgi:hypothetical protein